MSTAKIMITRTSPLTTVQDFGRKGHFGAGISASGPMDALSFARGGALLKTGATSGIEFTSNGLAFTLEGGDVRAAFTGGSSTLRINGTTREWGSVIELNAGDNIDLQPGKAGNYGYVRFDQDIDVPLVLDSRATNLVVGLGGFEGRALVQGDVLGLTDTTGGSAPMAAELTADSEALFRFVWGIHAERFSEAARAAFAATPFKISSKLDRMGVRLTDSAGIFQSEQILSLVSDPVVPGDIQILGDGTPIVLMRDHQPTGGYPRIGTLISTDLSRFAQMRPGREVRFEPVSVEHAHQLRQARRHQ